MWINTVLEILRTLTALRRADIELAHAMRGIPQVSKEELMGCAMLVFMATTESQRAFYLSDWRGHAAFCDDLSHGAALRINGTPEAQDGHR